MARKFISTILAASLAITAVSLPAKARANDDIVKFLAGATALVIIGKAIENNRAKADVRRDHQPRYVQPQRHDRKWKHHRDQDRNRWHRDRDNRRISLPASCRVNLRTPSGTISGYGYRCIQQNPRLARAIPGQCVTATRAYRGPRFIYSDRCLARAGYRVH
ncbi:MAG: hypothetical protein ACU0DK_07940 [Pseudooceanicola sp.]